MSSSSHHPSSTTPDSDIASSTSASSSSSLAISSPVQPLSLSPSRTFPQSNSQDATLSNPLSDIRVSSTLTQKQSSLGGPQRSIPSYVAGRHSPSSRLARATRLNSSSSPKKSGAVNMMDVPTRKGKRDEFLSSHPLDSDPTMTTKRSKQIERESSLSMSDDVEGVMMNVDVDEARNSDENEDIEMGLDSQPAGKRCISTTTSISDPPTSSTGSSGFDRGSHLASSSGGDTDYHSHRRNDRQLSTAASSLVNFEEDNQPKVIDPSTQSLSGKPTEPTTTSTPIVTQEQQQLQQNTCQSSSSAFQSSPSTTISLKQITCALSISSKRFDQIRERREAEALRRKERSPEVLSPHRRPQNPNHEQEKKYCLAIDRNGKEVRVVSPPQMKTCITSPSNLQQKQRQQQQQNSPLFVASQLSPTIAPEMVRSRIRAEEVGEGATGGVGGGKKKSKQSLSRRISSKLVGKRLPKVPLPSPLPLRSTPAVSRKPLPALPTQQQHRQHQHQQPTTSTSSFSSHVAVPVVPESYQIMTPPTARYDIGRDFEVGRTIGAGTYGRVHFGRSRVNGQEVAIKVLSKSKIYDGAQVDNTQSERRVLAILSSPDQARDIGRMSTAALVYNRDPSWAKKGVVMEDLLWANHGKLPPLTRRPSLPDVKYLEMKEMAKEEEEEEDHGDDLKTPSSTGILQRRRKQQRQKLAWAKAKKVEERRRNFRKTFDLPEQTAEHLHPFIVNLWGTVQDEKRVFLIMQLVGAGELFTLLRKMGKFPEPVAKFYSAEIVIALDYLHGLGIVFRDLKPENVLIGRDGHIKLTDFGFAIESRDLLHTMCGTPDYLAPELVRNESYTCAVDWYALGIMVYEMIFGHPPFHDSDQRSGMPLYRRILKGEMKWSPVNITPQGQNFIKQLTHRYWWNRLGAGGTGSVHECDLEVADPSSQYTPHPNPDKKIVRIRAVCNGDGPVDVFAHPWFGEVDWQAMFRKEIRPPWYPGFDDDGGGESRSGNGDKNKEKRKKQMLAGNKEREKDDQTVDKDYHEEDEDGKGTKDRGHEKKGGTLAYFDTYEEVADVLEYGSWKHLKKCPFGNAFGGF